MHDEVGFVHEHNEGLSDADYRAVQRAIMEHDMLELVTVGIDIGSSTSHLLFARVLFERRGAHGNDRFVVVDRSVLWRSPIMLTPFVADGTIDAHRLAHFVRDCYRQAGLTPGAIDTGAVILTGEAIRKRNARRIDEMLAGDSGRFVCATAGHRLECLLAAHGSGAVELNRGRGGRGLHVDIGGGTTKLAWIEGGEVRGVAAFAAGGRLVARDGDGRWSRVDDAARLVARDLSLAPGALADRGARRRLAGRLAQLITDQVLAGATDELGRELELTEPLQRDGLPDYVTLSGGVAEYVFGSETADYGDIAGDLAVAVKHEFAERVPVPTVDPGQRIRATVIGASQFSVQVSGRTIHLAEHGVLPVANLPVLRIAEPLTDDLSPASVVAAVRSKAEQHEVDVHGRLALAVHWAGPSSHPALLWLARTLADAVGRDGELLVVTVDADVARSLGALLTEEVAVNRPLVVLDSVELGELDFLDVGELLDPPGVVPLVIKSLLFA